jgi:hypothetical protein
MRIRAMILAGALVSAVVACTEKAAADLRGEGAPVAQIPPAERAAIYDRALRAAFDVNEALVLLVDPAKLPRSGGVARGDRIPAPVLAALERLGSVRGRCEPAVDTTRAARCQHASAGYVVRMSDVFDRAGDSVRVFIAVERYQPAGEQGYVARFAFEDGYDLVPKGAGWRVVRRGRKTS